MAGIHLLVLATAAFALAAAYHGDDLPPGPYCGLGGRRGGCCTNRRDACSHRILNTLCYCDEFCNMNRTQGNDDCCPDYEEVCLGQAPQPIVKGVCLLGHVKTDRCNKCSCEEVNGKPDWKCEQDDCMISDDVIYGVNQGGETWHAANYSKYVSKKLRDGLRYRLGTLPLDPDTRRMGSIQYNKPITKPYFSAVLQWPSYISPVADQGWCGSDWAVVIASIASDRFAIQSRGAESKLLSAQSLLSCDKRGQRGCDGGHIDRAWNFARVFGLVDEDCFPYKAAVTQCPYRVNENLLRAGCKPQNNKRTSKYKASPPYRLKKEEDIMYDLMESGPVLAVMTVYQDFFHYRSGVYRHTRHGNQVEQGLHSVKIVGWGGDGRDRYWIVANSWGQDWGQDGYFHIARGSNESGIESFVISGLMDVVEANQRK